VGELCSESALRPLDHVELLERASDANRSEKTVLVADDSTFIRNTMCGTLRGAGYTVEEAEDGSVAWEMIQKMLQQCEAEGSDIRHRLSLLITDVEMPQMDGLHLTSLVRKNEALNNLPIVIFSSLASDDNKRKWVGLGANHILTKPDLPNLVKVADELAVY
jgi:two-component system chemotaxis response regulator CheV